MIETMIHNKSALLMQAFLRLDHHLVGMKFFDNKNAHKMELYSLLEGQHSYCQMVEKASRSMVFKVYNESFSCDTSARMMGIRPYYECQEDIDGWFNNGFYENREIATRQKEEVRPVAKVNAGLVLGALEKLEEEPSLVLIACNPYQAMRLMQAYTYSYGVNPQLAITGMCGVCFESTSKPYTSGDISMSLLCSGSRANAGFTDDTMMISFPYHMMKKILKGLMETANKAEPDSYKEQIKERLRKSKIKLENELLSGQAYFYNDGVL